jgi:hypothetical protein
MVNATAVTNIILVIQKKLDTCKDTREEMKMTGEMIREMIQDRLITEQDHRTGMNTAEMIGHGICNKDREWSRSRSRSRSRSTEGRNSERSGSKKGRSTPPRTDH